MTRSFLARPSASLATLGLALSISLRDASSPSSLGRLSLLAASFVIFLWPVSYTHLTLPTNREV